MALGDVGLGGDYAERFALGLRKARVLDLIGHPLNEPPLTAVPRRSEQPHPGGEA